MATLFDPVRLGKLDLPSRIVMAPMTRSRAGPGGTATALMATYYAQRASAGLIVSEAVHPSAEGQGYLDTPGLHSLEQIESWRQVTDAVHAAGGRIFVQLQHCGRVSHPDLMPGLHPVAPSGVRADVQAFTQNGRVDCPIPTQLSPDGIVTTVADFVAAARAAVDVGFDGVELQGANGFLLSQFINPGSNLRTDRYGGLRENRIRFPVELTEWVADAIGPERVGLKISPGNPYNGMDPTDDAEDYAALVRALPSEIAYLHVAEKGDRLLSTRMRAHWQGTLILNPHPSDFAPAQQALKAGVADLVSFGSLFVSNPDLPARMRAGAPYNETLMSEFYGGGERGYTDYPSL